MRLVYDLLPLPQGAALSGRARTRHQLSSLLTEAYQNREALEEQIAQGRRNRKEAGNKYGVLQLPFIHSYQQLILSKYHRFLTHSSL